MQEIEGIAREQAARRGQGADYPPPRRAAHAADQSRAAAELRAQLSEMKAAHAQEQLRLAAEKDDLAAGAAAAREQVLGRLLQSLHEL